MYDAEEKGSKFLEAINRAALKNRQALDAEVKEKTRSEMEQAEMQIHNECRQKTQREIQKRKAATVRALAGYSTEKREAISLRRQAMEAEVFDAVQRNIAAFRQGKQYKKALLTSAKKMQPLFAQAEDLVVLVAQADLQYEADLKKIFGPCQVKADPTNQLGGLKAESLQKKLAADDTYAARLAAQREWFAENSGLKIV